MGQSLSSGLALVGGLAAGLRSGYRFGYEAGRWAEQEEMNRTVTVFLATAELRRGTLIANPERMFVSKRLPAERVPANAVTNLQQLRGMDLVRTLDAGAVCTLRNVGKF